eukprot:gene814-859_t
MSRRTQRRRSSNLSILSDFDDPFSASGSEPASPEIIRKSILKSVNNESDAADRDDEPYQELYRKTLEEDTSELLKIVDRNPDGKCLSAIDLLLQQIDSEFSHITRMLAQQPADRDEKTLQQFCDLLIKSYPKVMGRMCGFEQIAFCRCCKVEVVEAGQVEKIFSMGDDINARVVFLLEGECNCCCGIEYNCPLMLHLPGMCMCADNLRHVGYLNSGMHFGEEALELSDLKQPRHFLIETSGDDHCVFITCDMNEYQKYGGGADPESYFDKMAFLKTLPRLKGLPEGEVQMIAHCMQGPRTFSAFERLVEQGDKVEDILFIRSGSAQVLRTIPRKFNDPLILRIDSLKPGDVFAALAGIIGKHFRENVFADPEVKVYWISRQEFLRRLARRVLVAFTIGLREYPNDFQLLERAKRSEKWDRYKKNLQIDLKAKNNIQKVNEAFMGDRVVFGEFNDGDSSPSNSNPNSRPGSARKTTRFAKTGLTDAEKVDEEISFGQRALDKDCFVASNSSKKKLGRRGTKIDMMSAKRLTKDCFNEVESLHDPALDSFDETELEFLDTRTDMNVLSEKGKQVREEFRSEVNRAVSGAGGDVVSKEIFLSSELLKQYGREAIHKQEGIVNSCLKAYTKNAIDGGDRRPSKKMSMRRQRTGSIRYLC